MKRPFLWFLVGIISGIVFGRYVDCTCLKLFLFFVVYKLLAFALFKKFGNKEMLAIPIIAVIGAVMCTNAMNMDKNIVKLTDTDRQMLYGTVISTDISQNGRTVINTDVDYISDMKSSVSKSAKIKIYCNEAKDKFQPGDVIKANGKILPYSEPTNPYQMNYRVYMFSNGYVSSFWAYDTEKIGYTNGIIYTAEKTRYKINSFFDETMPEREASVAKALVTGYKSDIPSETRDTYIRLGISHVLAVSGLHVSIAALVVIYFMTKVLKLNKRIAVIPASLVLIVYLFISGFSPSAIRAVIMSVTSYVGIFLYREREMINTSAFAAFIMLLINPLYLWNTSFQLSFTGVAAVITAARLTEKNKELNKVGKSILFSVIAWIITSPAVMYFFGGVSLISVISNILLVPIISALTVVLMLAGALSLLLRFPAELLSIVARNVLTVYNNLAEKLSGFDIVYLNTAKPSFLAVVVIYIFIFGVLLNQKHKKRQLMFCIAGIICALVYVNTYINMPAESVFFDAGQGDASLINIPGRLVAVVDGGPSDGDEIVDYLEAKGEKADLVFVSHMDSDHLNGVLRLIETDMAECAVISDVSHENKENYDKFIKAAFKHNVKIIKMSEGDSIKVGDNCVFNCLYPPENYDGEENEGSLVISFDYYGTKILFTGDIDSKAEKKIVEDGKNISCDIIKIPHHGSKYSSSEIFIEKTNAGYAVIEAEKNNQYGFPTQEVMDRLEENNIESYVTGLDGAVMVKMDKDGNYKIKTYRNGN